MEPSLSRFLFFYLLNKKVLQWHLYWKYSVHGENSLKNVLSKIVKICVRVDPHDIINFYL